MEEAWESFITKDIAELILRAKAQVPETFKIKTIEEDYWLILHIDTKAFESHSLDDKIRIARVMNELCERIKAKGLPCYIQKA